MYECWFLHRCLVWSFFTKGKFICLVRKPTPKVLTCLLVYNAHCIFPRETDERQKRNNVRCSLFKTSFYTLFNCLVGLVVVSEVVDVILGQGCLSFYHSRMSVETLYTSTVLSLEALSVSLSVCQSFSYSACLSVCLCPQGMKIRLRRHYSSTTCLCFETPIVTFLSPLF